MNVSVVIPTHNRRDQLKRAVRSVLAQSALPDELIIVDDGSQPAVTLNDLPDIPSRIRFVLLRNSRPLGGNAARNRGVKAATAEWIAFLDDDDEYDDEKIECLSKMERLSPTSVDVFFHSSIIKVNNLDISWVSSPAYDAGKPFLNQLLVRNFVGGTSRVIIRRDVVLATGLFDESLPALQDYEMWLRLAKEGCTFRFINDALTVYYHDPTLSSISKSLDKYERALSKIERTYASDLRSLPFSLQRDREIRKYYVRSRKYLLGGKNVYAARSSLSAFKLSWEVKYLLLALASLLGCTFVYKVKSTVGNL